MYFHKHISDHLELKLFKIFWKINVSLIIFHEAAKFT